MNMKVYIPLLLVCTPVLADGNVLRLGNVSVDNIETSPVKKVGCSGNQPIVTRLELSDMISKGDDVTNVCTSEITSLSYLLAQTPNFNQDISGWDVSNVTNMKYAFNGAVNFNQDLSGWDVSSASNLNSMFYNASSFSQDLSGWHVSQITDSMYFRNFNLNSSMKSNQIPLFNN